MHSLIVLDLLWDQTIYHGIDDVIVRFYVLI